MKMSDGVVVFGVVIIAAVASLAHVSAVFTRGQNDLISPTWLTGDWGEAELGFTVSAPGFASVPHLDPIFLSSSHPGGLDSDDLDLRQEPPFYVT